MKILSAIIVLLVASIAHAQNPPNIVLVVAHELGRDWLPFEGSVEKVEVPRLDALRKEALRFPKAWATPHSGVSHATLMTGLYPFHHGWETASAKPLGGATPLLPAHLSRAGYRTAFAGSWPFADKPGTLGFQSHKTTESADDALAFSGTVIDGQGPFFLYVALPREATKDRVVYARQIAAIDAQVGAVLDMVNVDNTIVVFTADAGSSMPGKIRVPGMKRPTGVKPTKGMPPPSRGELTVLGINVPFIVRAPASFPIANKWTRDLVDFTDLLPTLIELAGGAMPEGLDGQSFADTLRGEVDPFTKRNWMMSQSGDLSLVGDWAYVYRSDKRLHGLYYDPHLQTNMFDITHNDKAVTGRGERLTKILNRVTAR
jgi:arylsulfatase A-like enzyme